MSKYLLPISIYPHILIYISIQKRKEELGEKKIFTKIK